MSVDEAFEMYETAVDKLLEKSDGLLLSLVIPCRYERLNQKGSEFNEKVNNKYLKILSVGWFFGVIKDQCHLKDFITKTISQVRMLGKNIDKNYHR
jgi:hypothetical protein